MSAPSAVPAAATASVTDSQANAPTLPSPSNLVEDQTSTATTLQPPAQIPSSVASANDEKDIESNLPTSAADGLVQKPFPRPLDTAKPAAPAQLTPDQQSKYEAVLKAVSEWTTVPTTSAKNAPTAPITDDERMFLTRECLLRYLRATKWNVTEAITRLQRTLTWRREYGLEKLTSDYISIENETGKQVILGYDIHARPCLYLLPSNQNTEKSDRQVEHLVYMLERVIELMGPDQETLALIVNFNETKSGQNASLGQAKQTLNILQNHYPERLGRALVINVPFVIWGFFKIITPFIDPLTREKLKFNEDLRQHVPAGHLMKSVGGDVEFRYDHSIYWPALNQLADKRRNEYRQRWIQGGKRIGEFEHYLKTGTSPSLSQSEGTNGVSEKS
ncbi:CRAL-TRIO domain-containing protein C23B6.04c [Aspergillus udagawae]|uniref:CRAL-TRIO domain-containing protein C23B6.04c n=1 Tax=Aspergillus udagawae TaxID=91492 RepID=A0ABQ1A1C3_9EURO|nr:CRAL-TRIO domain-containing protein C23B6.04c [Aspergillus udagawae]GFF71211.1 CRAL-TRIO domain-containing protein C23B6.04c [Aspergillus udagawae]GFG28037.1 CRAL-TRIO domain-containing protein C23B6.04c [Aspergillus udagawae]